nr:alpha/beta fold hydrolase [Nevskia sp.]
MTAVQTLPAPLPTHLLVFAHGKESGPWGIKISQLAKVAEACGYTVISPDYRQTMDPDRRIEQLLELAPKARGALVLAGSSMGGYVSAMAAGGLEPDGLFLIAPALYFPGYDREPPPPPALTRVVHGWDDDVVSPEAALRYAHTHKAQLTMLNGDHSLNARIPELSAVLRELLEVAKLHAAYRLARYVVSTPAGPVEVRVGAVDAATERLLASRCDIESNWAIVTACNPLDEVSMRPASAGCPAWRWTRPASGRPKSACCSAIRNPVLPKRWAASSARTRSSAPCSVRRRNCAGCADQPNCQAGVLPSPTGL